MKKCKSKRAERQSVSNALDVLNRNNLRCVREKIWVRRPGVGVKALLSSFWFGMGSKTCTGKQFPCYSHPFDTCVIWHWRTQNLRCICTLYVLDSLQQQRQSLRAPKTWRWLTSDSQWLTSAELMCAARVLLCVCHLLIMFRKYVDCNKGIYMCKGASIICVRVGMEIFNETTFLTTQLGGGPG